MTTPQVRTERLGQVAIMQMIDSLDAGGAERVAINLANGLAGAFESHLCVTRRTGPLEALVSPDVKRLVLGRRRTVDFPSLIQLRAYIRQHHIRILHAHSTSLFLAAAVKSITPGIRVVWHDHYGDTAGSPRPVLPYWMGVRFVSSIISVNTTLADWAVEKLGVSRDRVAYLPNFAETGPGSKGTTLSLPGTRGGRVVCVANFRPQKDHSCLLDAFDKVCASNADAHLLLVGVSTDSEYLRSLEHLAKRLGLNGRVTFLGQRDDVAAILENCDIGVLASRSEGLPLALLEYGRAGLGVVVTDVGQCADVVENGLAGVVVPPADPPALAAGILDLLDNEEKRIACALRLRLRVEEQHNSSSSIKILCDYYRALLA